MPDGLSADEKQAYTLSDESTFLVLQPSLRLKALRHSDPELLNTYSVIELSSSRFPGINAEGGHALALFLTGGEGRGLIAGFGKEKFGKALFEPVETAERTEGR